MAKLVISARKIKNGKTKTFRGYPGKLESKLDRLRTKYTIFELNGRATTPEIAFGILRTINAGGKLHYDYAQGPYVDAVLRMSEAGISLTAAAEFKPVSLMVKVANKYREVAWALSDGETIEANETLRNLSVILGTLVHLDARSFRENHSTFFTGFSYELSFGLLSGVREADPGMYRLICDDLALPGTQRFIYEQRRAEEQEAKGRSEAEYQVIRERHAAPQETSQPPQQTIPVEEVGDALDEFGSRSSRVQTTQEPKPKKPEPKKEPSDEGFVPDDRFRMLEFE